MAGAAGLPPLPSDWRDEVIYFLLPDRFSDGREGERPLLDRSDLWAARPQGWRWDRWARSGRERYQGGTLSGVASRLEYLDDLGVTALWIGPVWKQRPVAGVEGGPAEPDDYHGYAVQDFMEVDPRLGTRADLVALVRQAHRRGIRVILDVLLNHSGENWDYDLDGQDVVRPPYRAGPPYDFGAWRDGKGGRLPRGIVPTGPDHGVWPEELQSPESYTRAGGDGGSFGPGGDEDPDAPYRRADWFSRDLDMGTRLQTMIEIYSYWIALADLDGLRVDTLKHVPWSTPAPSAGRSGVRRAPGQEELPHRRRGRRRRHHPGEVPEAGGAGPVSRAGDRRDQGDAARRGGGQGRARGAVRPLHAAARPQPQGARQQVRLHARRP
ncbi:alpha-amylase family glycosyl hydrolase [Nonomuraea recticatena]|uniref:alpha-amylase family glycosyl hydrolase n=1 Tax=Nonomuraea recticatena TaxID=46178 RepID=UPI003611C055